MTRLDLANIHCVVFDFGMTLSSDRYFTVVPPSNPEWTAVIQRQIFDRPLIVNAWMKGDLSLIDVAQIVAREIDLPISVIVEWMERGCSTLTFNPAVWEFACLQRKQGRKTALVTANMDVFTNVVVPAHRLDTVFDVILNTSDCHELRKHILWDHAFAQLGEGIEYANSLLIDDSPTATALFRERGGAAHQYENDDRCREWLRQIGG